MNFATAYIKVSDHAIQRLKERFSHKFPVHNLNDRRNVIELIKYEIKNGVLLDDWKRVPFYVNRMSIQFGPGNEIIKASGMFYVCNYYPEENKLVVKSVVNNMLYYQTEGSVLHTTSGGAKWYKPKPKGNLRFVTR